MSNDQLLAAPDLETPARDVQHRIIQQTGGRIDDLEVGLQAGRIEVRGRAASFHIKQLAIQAILEVIHTWSNARQVEVDVRIKVDEVSSDSNCSWF